MNNDLFRGQRVRLSMVSPEKSAEAFSRWGRNTEYIRLLDNDPARLVSAKRFKEWMDKDLEKNDPSDVFFMVNTLQDDRTIGFLAMFNLSFTSGDAFVAIALGEPEFWGQGYGTEAMNLLLGYAFDELNLHRVSLYVFEYNPRARRSYEKAGFQIEGRVREALLRDGQRYDVLVMGVLREEWEQLHAS